MRVLLVANTLPPLDLSGVGEQVLQLAAGLRERGHEVVILGRGKGQARGPKLLFPLAVVAPLARAVRSFRPDVVQVHESDVALGLARLRSVRGGAPHPLLVALLQVSYKREKAAARVLRDGERILGVPGAVERRFRLLKAPLQIALGRWTARCADLVLAPSRATAAEIADDYGVRLPAVVPNVTGAQDPGESSILNAGSSTGYLLFVGRLRIRKGVEVLLDSLRRLEDRGVRVSLLIAGEGEHRRALEQRARTLGLDPERVRFLGRASAPQVQALLRGAAALVVPSIYEGMPLVLLEAMSAGIPVVASRVSGIPEVVEDGKSGWLVPPENPLALASALEAVLTDAGEARRRGVAGHSRVEACYRPRHAAEAWESAILPALTRRNNLGR